MGDRLVGEIEVNLPTPLTIVGEEPALVVDPLALVIVDPLRIVGPTLVIAEPLLF